jgi:threonine dehydrogenase-like Zn-dependent dehydrogenase
VLGVGRNGGMADDVFVPRRCLTFLPSTVDVKDGCLVEPLAIAVHGMRISGFNGNQRVAVIGGGTIGICAVAVAKASSDTVGLAARYSHQRAAGSLLGATDVDGQYDLIVECTGNSEAMNQAVRLCSPGATILALGTNWEGIQIPEVAAQSKEITMVFSTMYSARGAMRDFDVAAMLLARNPNIPKALITHRYPMVEVSKAFAAARDRRAGAIKVVLEP